MEGMRVLTSPTCECGGLTFSFAVLSVRIALNSKSREMLLAPKIAQFVP